MYKVLIKETSTSSAVAVSKLSELEQAISFAFQLHQIASCKHYITVLDDRSQVLASFIRQETITLPSPKSAADSQPSQSTPKKSLFGKK